jgi:hypothetical protein
MFQQAKRILFTLSLLMGCQAMAWAAEPTSPFPGIAPTDIQSGDSKPGSLLIYNYYTSSATNPAEDTQVSLTNTNSGRAIFVHMFFVANNCTVADSYICLTPNQTARFFASQADPGITGYMMGVATNQNGCPVEFNFLIGSEYVKLVSGHAAKLSAEAIYANYDGVLPRCSLTTADVELKFNGRQYARLPRVLALDEINSNLDGNSTMLIVNGIGGSLSTGAAATGTLFGILYDDVENGFSFSLASSCQVAITLSNVTPRVTPSFINVIPQGRSGWMRLWSTQERPLTGAALRFNADTATQRESFTGGATLNHLRMTETASVFMPVFPPSC